MDHTKVRTIADKVTSKMSSRLLNMASEGCQESILWLEGHRIEVHTYVELVMKFYEVMDIKKENPLAFAELNELAVYFGECTLRDPKIWAENVLKVESLLYKDCHINALIEMNKRLVDKDVASHPYEALRDHIQNVAPLLLR